MTLRQGSECILRRGLQSSGGRWRGAIRARIVRRRRRRGQPRRAPTLRRRAVFVHARRTSTQRRKGARSHGGRGPAGPRARRWTESGGRWTIARTAPSRPATSPLVTTAGSMRPPPLGSPTVPPPSPTGSISSTRSATTRADQEVMPAWVMDQLVRLAPCRGVRRRGYVVKRTTPPSGPMACGNAPLEPGPRGRGSCHRGHSAPKRLRIPMRSGDHPASLRCKRLIPLTGRDVRRGHAN